MEKSREQAVWERVTGEGPLGPRLLEIIARKTEDVRLYRDMAGKFPARQQLFRDMAAQIAGQVRLLKAEYYVLTEQAPRVPGANIPQIPGGKQGLLLLLRREASAGALPGNCDGPLQQTLQYIQQQDGARYRLLLGLLKQRIE